MRGTILMATAVALMPVPDLDMALAGTTAATMQVSAVVEPSCHVDVAPLMFDGATSAHARVDAQAAIALACTPDTSFTVAIDEGQNTANGRRRMVAALGNVFLAYDIYQDAGRTRPWGSTAGETVGGVIPASGHIELNAYGRIAATGAAPNRYADTVTVLVMF